MIIPEGAAASIAIGNPRSGRSCRTYVTWRGAGYRTTTRSLPSIVVDAAGIKGLVVGP